MHQVDSEDATFLFLENQENPAHLGLLALYDQSELGASQVRFQHILQHIHNRLNSAPVFNQKLKRIPGDLDYPYWIEDTNFDLNYHIRHLALPKPGDWRQLCIQVSRLHSRPLDLRRPLWELYVIEGLDSMAEVPKGSFALYFKIHHCAMDEFTALELLESLHETTFNPVQYEQQATQVSHPSLREPGASDIVVQAVAGNIFRSLKLGKQVLKNPRFVGRQLTKSAIAQLRRAPRVTTEQLVYTQQTHFSAHTGNARVFDGGFYPRENLETFCEMVSGASLHHALAVVCGEATRRYLNAKGDAVKSPLSARFQLDTRNAGAHALAGNKMAMQQIELYTDIENLVERLYAIVGSNRHVTERELESRSEIIRSFYENVPAFLLSAIGRLSQRDLLALEAGGSCGIATLHGPDEPVYLLGARLGALCSVSPLYKGCGLMYCASQYGDRIALNFTSSRDLLPDPARLVEYLEETMNDLTALCV